MTLHWIRGWSMCRADPYRVNPELAPPVIYSHPWSPMPSTTASAPELPFVMIRLLKYNTTNMHGASLDQRVVYV